MYCSVMGWILFALMVEGPPDQPVTQKAEAVRVSQIASAIDRLIAAEHTSWHSFLRDGALNVRPGLLKRPWAEVQELMQSRHYGAIEAWENGDAVHSYHLIKHGHALQPKGKQFDVYLLLSAPNLKRGLLPAIPGELYAADIALVSDLRMPLSQALKIQPYAKGTVFAAALNSKALKDELEGFTFVKRIYAHYGHLIDRWSELSPYGFSVTVELASVPQGRDGKRIYLSMTSGLDPTQPNYGAPRTVPNLVPADTLGTVEFRGSNSWYSKR
jgi:hypothetical protein